MGDVFQGRRREARLRYALSDPFDRCKASAMLTRQVF